MKEYSHHSRIIPLTVLDQLLYVLKKVDPSGHQKLYKAIAEYMALLSNAPLR
jgi:hypothetical protein